MRLTRNWVIPGYGARLDPRKLGRAFPEAKPDKTTPDVFEQFARAIRPAGMPHGGGRLRLSRQSARRRHGGLRLFLSSVTLALPGVKEMRRYAVMEVVDGAPLAAG